MTQTKRTVLILAGSVGLMMTGFGIIMPVFARRLSALGGGVETLGVMAMVFALAHMLLSPLAGGWSDRIGRKPLILIGLGGFAVSNLLYLAAGSTLAFIAARAVAGVLTAGLYPAAMGAVDDLSRPEERASRVGLVMAGYGTGLIAGPVLGGVLYDGFGFAAPFLFSGALGLAALVAAAVWVPETIQGRRRAAEVTPTDARPTWSLVVLTILAVELGLTLAFTYVEPQMVFHIYDGLGWSTAGFGLVAGAYGVALALAQAMLSKSSDRWGRQPVVLVGIGLSLALYFGLAFIASFPWMLAAAFAAGLGTGLVGPALSALILDLADEAHRGRMLGLKSAASALGGVLGPLVIALLGPSLSPAGVFLSAAALVVTLLLLALIGLTRPVPRPALA